MSATLTVLDAESGDLFGEARRLIDWADWALADAVRLMWEAGRVLLEAKAATPRGEWGRRLDAAGIGSQRASEAMRIAGLDEDELPETLRTALAEVATGRRRAAPVEVVPVEPPRIVGANVLISKVIVRDTRRVVRSGGVVLIEVGSETPDAPGIDFGELRDSIERVRALVADVNAEAEPGRTEALAENCERVREAHSLAREAAVSLSKLVEDAERARSVEPGEDDRF